MVIMDSKQGIHNVNGIKNLMDFTSFFSKKMKRLLIIFLIFPGLFFIPVELCTHKPSFTEPVIEKLSNNKDISLPQPKPVTFALVEKKQKKIHHKHNESFDTIINQAADQYEIDPALIKAIIMAESGYNPKALSKKGAMGLMQLMPNTAKWLGVEDSFNPEHNINGGVKYFKYLMKKFDGDIKLALAAYNAGSRYVRQYQGIPPFKATRYYITKVFKYYNFYKNQTI